MTDRRLWRHLAFVVALKIALLGALWWAFVRDARTPVDAAAAAAHLVAPQPGATTSPGAKP
jgi:hypothetical protein